MTSFIGKFKGAGEKIPPRPQYKSIGLSGVGGCLAIAVVAFLSNSLSVTLILGSFGASCLLLFGFPDVPFAQPRNVIGGHFLSSFIGLTFLYIFGPHWWTVALATGTAIALMIYTRTAHPPAGANPVIVYLSQPDWSFLFFPTLFGAVILTAISLVYNNATRENKYPRYWF
jgi:CBS-domain-containing membrane protein